MKWWGLSLLQVAAGLEAIPENLLQDPQYLQMDRLADRSIFIVCYAEPVQVKSQRKQCERSLTWWI